MGISYKWIRIRKRRKKGCDFITRIKATSTETTDES